MTTKAQKAIVKWKDEQIAITFYDVKNLICPLATDQETAIFLKTCQSLQLNPFAKEIYLIKYGERDKAAMVIAIDSYLKSAEANDNFNGFEAGIILTNTGGKLEFREGSLLLPEEATKLAGGWARVYRKDREKPFYMAVNKTECLRYTRDGNLTQFWAEEKQPSMLRKTALKRALVEAFPSLFAGTLAAAEVADDAEYHEMPEGEVPPALEKDGKPDWKKFWARVKSELGLTTVQARELLQVVSIKRDLIDQGVSMENIWDGLVNALQGQHEASRSEQVIDTQTGEIITSPDDLEEELFGEAEEAGAAAPAEAQNEEPTGTAAPAKPKRNPNDLHSIDDLIKACHEDFKMQPGQVYSELNVSSYRELQNKSGTPAEHYAYIAQPREE